MPERSEPSDSEIAGSTLANLLRAPKARLFTNWGTRLHIDAASGELRHDSPDAAGNAMFVADGASGGRYRRGWLMYEAEDRLVPVVCSLEHSWTTSSGRLRPASHAPTSLEIIHLERGIVALKADDRFLCALPDGRVTLRSPRCSIWECFLASEDWCTPPRTAADAQDQRQAAGDIAWRDVAGWICEPAHRAQSRNTAATKIVIWGSSRGSPGRISYDLCKALTERGYVVDLLDGAEEPGRKIGSLLSYYDFFMTSVDRVGTLRDRYGVPLKCIIGISHQECEIRTLINDRGVEAFDELAGYGVVGYQLYDTSAIYGVRRPPLVVQLGVDSEQFAAAPPKRLVSVGYASSYSQVTPAGIEVKRGELAEAAARDAQLVFKMAGAGVGTASLHDMPAFYRSVDAVLISSLTEGAPLPVREAAAAGRLVISTPVGDFPLLATQGIGVIAPIEAHKYKKFVAKTLAFYKENPSAFEEKCRRGQDAARMIDWQYMIENWVELIETAGDRLSEQALSHQRAGRYREAAGAFAVVAEREADAERKWFALWQHARCLRELGDGEGFVRMALRAFREHPRRAEPLHDLAQYYQSIQNGAPAALFARAALAIPVPEGDLLPMDLELYKFGLRNSFSAIARSSSDDEVREYGRGICEWLVLDRDTPAHLRALAGCTLGGYAGDAQLLMPSLRFTPLPVECPEGFHPCNTGIGRDGNRLIAVVRAVNWLLRDGRYVLMAGHDTYRSHLVHVALDNELRPVTCKLVNPPTDLPVPRYHIDLGFRDPRPFIWQGELWCICAFRELNEAGLAEMVLLRIDRSDPERIAIAEWRAVPSGMPVKWEGNWMPQIVGDELGLVYSVDPTRILTDTGEVRYDQPTAIHAESFRGGSQAVRLDDGWLMVIHEVELVKDRRQYFHRFIWMDDDNQLRRLSRRFYFREIGYEFVAGMAWHPDDERLVISFSVNDIDQYIAAVDANDIRAVLLDIPGYERASAAALAEAKSTLTVVSDLSALSGRFVAVTKGHVNATFFINNENDGIMKHHAAGEFYESEELDIICRYYSGKGTFVDIGANVGNHTIYISKTYDKPRITVFEPNPAAIPILRANLALNGCTTVDTTHLGIGLGAAPGRLRGTTPDSNNLGGTIYTNDQFGDVASTDGDAVLREEAVEFVKLDVEGMETEILRGLCDTINRCRPTLFVEVFDRHLDAFRAWCTAMSYSICEDYTRYPHICNYLIRPSECISLLEEVRAGSGKR